MEKKLKKDFDNEIGIIIRNSMELGVMCLVEKLAQNEIENAIQLLKDLSSGSKESMDKVLGECYDD